MCGYRRPILESFGDVKPKKTQFFSPVVKAESPVCGEATRYASGLRTKVSHAQDNVYGFRGNEIIFFVED